MKTEHYLKLIETLGEEKANEIRKKEQERKEDLLKINKLEAEREKKFVELAIQKEDLEDYAYYQGFRFRGHGIAQWDARIGKFLILAYNFDNPYVERLEHFGDTYEKRFDGFVPIEKIDKYKFNDIKDKRVDVDKIEEEIDKLKKK